MIVTYGLLSIASGRQNLIDDRIAGAPATTYAILHLREAGDLCVSGIGRDLRDVTLVPSSVSSNVTVVSRMRGQSGIIGFAAVFHSASAEQCCQTNRSG